VKKYCIVLYCIALCSSLIGSCDCNNTEAARNVYSNPPPQGVNAAVPLATTARINNDAHPPQEISGAKHPAKDATASKVGKIINWKAGGVYWQNNAEVISKDSYSYGFIEAENEEFYFNISNIAEGADLKIGDKVTFDISNVATGHRRRAINVR
jgi:cold shock CspA family protein